MSGFEVIFFFVGLSVGVFCGVIVTSRDRTKLAKAHDQIAAYRKKISQIEGARQSPN